ncbi:MAG: hypothetical protein AAGF07_00705 [Patescibacteria group bacterium]
MIYLNATTLKVDLIRTLENEADKADNLYLIIDSLPTFLNTPIAFTVFNYQISRYPRKVYWWSYNPSLLEFLKGCTANVSKPDSASYIQANKNKIIPYNSLSPVAYDKQNESENTLSAKDIMSENKYQPLNLIHDHNYVHNPEETYSEEKQDSLPETQLAIDESQNFDTWIQKIEATKNALSSLKISDATENKVVYNNRSSAKLFRILTLSLILSLSFALSIVLLPAKVYTIELGAATEESSSKLELDINEFTKSTHVLSANAEIKPRGTKEVPTDLSIGKVSLFNDGNRPVNLDNGLFRLVIDEKYYQVLPDSTIPKSFAIPPKTERDEDLNFRIQALNPGDEYNLPADTRFDIVNLQGTGRKVCSGCYAISTTEIKNSTLSGENIVTEYDQSFITQSVEAKLAQQRSSLIKDIQKAEVFTDENWYKHTESKYNFSHSLNESTELLTLEAGVTTNIYYLTRVQIEEQLKSTNQEINSFGEIFITEIENNPRNSDLIKVTIFFTYETENTCLDKQKFVSELSKDSFEEAKKQILIDCPEVLNIERKDIGLNVPGVPQRIDLNVTSS